VSDNANKNHPQNSIPAVKQSIRHCSAAQAREFAERTLALGSAAAVRAYLESIVL